MRTACVLRRTVKIIECAFASRADSDSRFAESFAQNMGQEWVSRHVVFTKDQVLRDFSGTCNLCCCAINSVRPRSKKGPSHDVQLREPCVMQTPACVSSVTASVGLLCRRDLRQPQHIAAPASSSDSMKWSRE
jgi:hypothetical protein